MSEIQKSALWESLSEVIESEEKTVKSPEPPSTVQEEFGDRIAQRVVNGFFPLAVLYVAAVALGLNYGNFALANSILLLVGGVFMAPVAAWLFRPLVSSEFGLNIKAFLAVGLGFFFAVPLLQWVPIGLGLLALREGHRFTLNAKGHPYLGAWQGHLEHALRPGRALGYLLCLVLIVCLVQWIKSRNPWIQSSDSRWWTGMPAAGLMVLPWALLASPLLLSSDIESWRREVAPHYEKCPIANLPQGDFDNPWRKLNETYYEGYKDKGWDWLRDTREGKDYVRAQEQRVLKLLEENPPSTLEEFDEARIAFNDVNRFEILQRPLTVARALHGPDLLGVYRQQSSWNWREIGRWAGQSQRSTGDLEASLEELRELRQAYPSSLQEMDIRVYHLSFGSKRNSGLYQIDGVANRPLKIGVWETEYTPLRIASARDKVRLVKAWLETRPLFQDGFTEAEAMAMREERKPSLERMGATRFFQHRMFSDAENDEAAKVMEALEVYLQLRLRSLKGESLEALPFEQTGPWEITTGYYDGARDNVRIFLDRETKVRWLLP